MSPFGRWSSFDDCVRDLVENEGKDEESARGVCGALQRRLGRESFDWAGSVRPIGRNLIRGRALHPVQTVHPEEWPSVRIYLEGELEKGARTLAGKPLLLDHVMELPPPNRVIDADYEDGAVEYVAEVSDEILQKVREGLIRHCSVEFDWEALEKLDGVAPRNITFTGLSLLERFEPGDPLTTVEVWEGLIARLGEAKIGEQAEPQEFIYYGVRDPAAFLQEHFFTTWIDRVNGIQAINGRLRDDPEGVQSVALLFMKAGGWTLEKMRDWLRDHPQYWRGPEAEPSAVGVQPAPPQLEVQPVIGEQKMGGRGAEAEEEGLKTLEGRVAALESRLLEQRAPGASGLGQDGEPRRGEPKTDGERLIDHYGEEKALQLLDLIGEDAYKLLPPRGTSLEGSLGEAVIDPAAAPPEPPKDMIPRSEILALLPERVPRHWGNGPFELVRKIRRRVQA